MSRKFVSGLDLDPSKGSFHSDFFINECSDVQIFPHLNASQHDSPFSSNKPSKVSARHPQINPCHHDEKEEKVDEVHLQTSDTTSLQKVRKVSRHLYKKKYRPDIQTDRETERQTQQTDKKTSKQTDERTNVKKKKPSYSISQLTNLSHLNHTTTLTSEQQRLCDLLTDPEEDDEESEEGEQDTPLQEEEKKKKKKRGRQPTINHAFPNTSIGEAGHETNERTRQRQVRKKRPDINFTQYRTDARNAHDIFVRQIKTKPSDDVWTLAKLSSSPDVDDIRNQLLIPAIFDSGNQSMSVIPYNLYCQLKKTTDCTLQPYERRVKGVNGAAVHCYGTTTKPLYAFVKGFSKPFEFYALVIDSPSSLHLNISLATLKSRNISLDFSNTENTTMTCRQTQETIQLQKRGQLFLDKTFLPAQQICDLVDTYVENLPQLPSELLMELNQMKHFVPHTLARQQTLSEINDKISIHDNLIDAVTSSLQVTELSQKEFAKLNHKEIEQRCRKQLSQRSNFNGKQEQVVYPSTHVEIPPRSQVYIRCKSQLNLGSQYYAENSHSQFSSHGLAVPAHLATCSSPHGDIYVPVLNLNSYPVTINAQDAVAWLHCFGDFPEDKKGQYSLEIMEPDPGVMEHNPPQVNTFTPASLPQQSQPSNQSHPTHDNIEQLLTKREKRDFRRGYFSSWMYDDPKPDKSKPNLHQTANNSDKDQIDFDPHWEPGISQQSQPLTSQPPLQNPTLPHKKTRQWADQVPTAALVKSEQEARLHNKTPTLHPTLAAQKREKLKHKQFLKHIENAKVTPGFWVQGQLHKVEKQLDHAEIDAQIQNFYKAESSKFSLHQETRPKLDDFFMKECNFQNNPVLQKYPQYLPKILDILYKHRYAFTTHEDHPIYKQEIGNCKFYTYQPQLIDGYQDHIFNSPIKKMDSHEEKSLLDILLRWEAQNILTRQDVRADPKAQADTLQQNPNPPQNPNPNHSSPPTIPNPKAAKRSPDPSEPFRSETEPNRTDPEKPSSQIRSNNNFRIVLVNKKVLPTSGARPLAKRFTLDLRAANRLSVQHKFHLQSASSHLANLVPGRVFNTMDFSNFYSTINLTSRGSELFSFNTERFGSYSFLRLPQGYCNSPHIASQLGAALAAQLPPHYISIFSDDSLQIGQGSNMSEAIENLMEKMTLFLQQVIRFGLLINPEKCSLFLPSVNYLGFVISEHSISMKPDCMQGIINYIIPKEPKSLRRFLGIVQYYSHMIPHLSHYTANLFSACNRNTPDWKLSSQELENFLEVKRRFLKSPAVGFPQLDNLRSSPLRVYLDWSKLSISVSLTQLQYCPITKSNVEKLISCMGRKNPNSIKESGSTRGESQALLLATTKYRHFLILAPFLVFTDNLSLYYLSNLKNLSGHYHRLFESLSEFTFYLYTLRSSQNHLCDFLSRENMPPMTESERHLLLDNPNEQSDPFDAISIPHLPIETDDTVDQISTKNPITGGNQTQVQKADYLVTPQNPNSSAGSIFHCNQGPPRGSDYLVDPNHPNHKIPTLPHKSHSGGSPLQVKYLVSDPTVFEPKSPFQQSEFMTGSSILQLTSVPVYKQHNFDAFLQPFSSKSPRHLSSAVCQRYASHKQCAHIKISVAPTQGDHIQETSCLPTLTNTDIHRLFGGDNTLIQNISREELLKYQQSDKDLVHIRHYLENGFPSLREFQRLYPSERTSHFYSMRKQLMLTPDQIICVLRLPSQPVMAQRVILPNNLIFRALVLTHCAGQSFHKSIKNTYDQINQHFYIHRLADHVRYFIRSCHLCFLSKKAKPSQKCIPSLFPSFVKAKQAQPDALVFCDLSGALPTTLTGNCVFILFLNFYSGHVQLYPMKDSTTNSTLIALTQYVASFPLSHLVTDGGSNFTSLAMQEAMSQLRIQHSYSPVYNPASEASERKIRDTKVFLRCLLAHAPDHSCWDLYLPTAQFAINCRAHHTSGISPIELTSIYIPTSPLTRWIPQPPAENNLEGTQEKVGAGNPLESADPNEPAGPGRPHTTPNVSTAPHTKRLQIANIPQHQIDDLRRSHPHKITSHISFPRLDLFSVFLAKAIYCQNQIEGRYAAYVRAQAVYSKHQHPLHPLTEKSIGLAVWRYIQRPVSGMFSKSLVSRWSGPFEIDYVAGPAFCCVRSLFQINGKTIYLDSSIGLLWPYTQHSFFYPPTKMQHPYLDSKAGQQIEDDETFQLLQSDAAPPPFKSPTSGTLPIFNVRKKLHQAKSTLAVVHPGTSKVGVPDFSQPGQRSLVPAPAHATKAPCQPPPTLAAPLHPPTSQFQIVQPAPDIHVWPPNQGEQHQIKWDPIDDTVSQFLDIDDTACYFLPPVINSLLFADVSLATLNTVIASCEDIEQNLLFHRILPFSPKTRLASSALQRLLDEEKSKMMTLPQSSTTPKTHSDTFVGRDNDIDMDVDNYVQQDWTSPTAMTPTRSPTTSSTPPTTSSTPPTTSPTPPTTSSNTTVTPHSTTQPVASNVVTTPVRKFTTPVTTEHNTPEQFFTPNTDYNTPARPVMRPAPKHPLLLPQPHLPDDRPADHGEKVQPLQGRAEAVT